MNARKHRAIESRRLNQTERTQRFIDKHPELIPQPLSYTSIGFAACANSSCNAIRPREEMIGRYCSLKCSTISQSPNFFTNFN